MNLGIAKQLSIFSLGAAVLLASGLAFADAPGRSPGDPDAGPSGDGECGGHRGRGGHGGGRHMGKMFDRFDADGDGRVLIKDLPERFASRIGEADTNRDGALTKDELKAAHEAKRAEMKAKADTNKDGTVSDAERNVAREVFMKERFAKSDTNKDGALTAAEVGERKYGFLSAADTNGDKRITQAEIAAAFKNGTLKHRMHGRHGGSPATK